MANPYNLVTAFPQDFQFVNPTDGNLSIAWYYWLLGVHNTITPYTEAQPVTATSATTLNVHNGATVALALGANIATLNVLNWDAVTAITLVITNSASHTIVWPANTKWPGGSAPTLTTSGIDIIRLFSPDGGTTIYGQVIGQAYA